MQDAQDLERFAEVVEADAVIAEAEAKFNRFDVGQAVEIAVAGENIIGETFEQIQGSLPIDAAHVGTRLWRPRNAFRHGC
jgi:hypothetical protein